MSVASVVFCKSNGSLGTTIIFFVASEEDISVQLAALVQLTLLQYQGLYTQDAQQINDAKMLNVQMWTIKTLYTSSKRICNRYTGNWINAKVLNRALQRLWVHLLLQSKSRDKKFPLLIEKLKLHHSWLWIYFLIGGTVQESFTDGIRWYPNNPTDSFLYFFFNRFNWWNLWNVNQWAPQNFWDHSSFQSGYKTKSETHCCFATVQTWQWFHFKKSFLQMLNYLFRPQFKNLSQMLALQLRRQSNNQLISPADWWCL